MTVSENNKPLLGKIKITTILSVETGLHIGGGSENLDIGGLDKPVIRDPITRHPYLPGSSIKGKLRSTTERLFNKPVNRSGGSKTYRYESDDLVDGFTEIKEENKPSVLIFYDGARNCEVCRIFGSTGIDCWVKNNLVESEQLEKIAHISSKRILRENNSRWGIFLGDNETDRGDLYSKVRGRNSPARLIVRDCHLLPESIEKLEDIDSALYMTERKFENGIDRITAAANPRQIERVPKGAKFNFEMIYTVENKEQVEEDIKNLAIALAILEDDALGGHGSRGYGKVRFKDFKFFYRDLSQYRLGSGNGLNFKTPIDTKDCTDDLLENFGSLRDKIQQRLLPGKEA
ncbi:MAG: type III-A CRISPR-associated RAMP protein Csm3 [Microcoleaceae cyanobacterium]